jgi:hypothetical protein
LWSLLPSPVTSSLLHPYVFLSNLYSSIKTSRILWFHCTEFQKIMSSDPVCSNEKTFPSSLP